MKGYLGKHIIVKRVMKKSYLLIFGLLPILSYSQTYSELMWIVGENDFKRVMIENDFQFDTILDGTIVNAPIMDSFPTLALSMITAFIPIRLFSPISAP